MRIRISLNRQGFVNLFTAIVGAFLFIALIAYMGFLIGTRSGQRESQSAPTPIQSAVTPQEPSSTLTVSPIAPTPTTSLEQGDPTAGWKVYVNSEYGYSIKYLPDWSLREIPNVVFSSPNIEKTVGGTVIGGGEVVIFVNDNHSNKPLSEFYDALITRDFRTMERKEINLNGLLALQYVAEGAGIDGTMTGVIVTTGNRLYRIESYYGRKDKDEIVEALKLMLESLEFKTK